MGAVGRRLVDAIRASIANESTLILEEAKRLQDLEAIELPSEACDHHLSPENWHTDEEIRLKDTIPLVKALFFDSMPEDSGVCKIESIKPVVVADRLRRFLTAKATADADACVEATFHGTDEKAVDAILATGLDPKKCTASAHGKGVYIATHAGF